MRRVRAVLTFVLWEFGPLLALLALSAMFSLKVRSPERSPSSWSIRSPFVAAYSVYADLFVVQRPRSRFGTIDLLAETPFMLKYEAVITNLATVSPLWRARVGPIDDPGNREQRREAFPDRADVRHFFRLLTLFWAVYFFLKAGLYFWLSVTLPTGRAIFCDRSSEASVWNHMVAVSSTQGRRLFFLCQRLGLLPVVAMPEQPKTP